MTRPFHHHDWRVAGDTDGWRCAGCGEWHEDARESGYCSECGDDWRCPMATKLDGGGATRRESTTDYLAWAQLVATLALIASLILHWLIRGTL